MGAPYPTVLLNYLFRCVFHEIRFLALFLAQLQELLVVFECTSVAIAGQAAVLFDKPIGVVGPDEILYMLTDVTVSYQRQHSRKGVQTARLCEMVKSLRLTSTVSIRFPSTRAERMSEFGLL